VGPLSVAVLPIEHKPLPAALTKVKSKGGGERYGASLRVALERYLAQQAGLQVVPCADEQVKGLSPREAARRLHVRLLLRGSVEFLPENQIVTALELLDAPAGSLVWSQAYREPGFYDWPPVSFLPMQEKLAKDLTEQLPLRLLRGDRALRYVAVLPYLPLPPDASAPAKKVPQLNATAEIIVRNLATALSRDRRLKVVPPSGIVRLKPGAADAGPEAVWSEARRTAKRLGVDAFFEVTGRASVGPKGLVWGLHVELVEVESGAALWAETVAPLPEAFGGALSSEALAWPETLPARIASRASLLAGK
jgi:TolB-like protein